MKIDLIYLPVQSFLIFLSWAIMISYLFNYNDPISWIQIPGFSSVDWVLYFSIQYFLDRICNLFVFSSWNSCSKTHINLIMFTHWFYSYFILQLNSWQMKTTRKVDFDLDQELTSLTSMGILVIWCLLNRHRGWMWLRSTS